MLNMHSVMTQLLLLLLLSLLPLLMTLLLMTAKILTAAPRLIAPLQVLLLCNGSVLDALLLWRSNVQKVQHARHLTALSHRC
jgi:hypothetical protein